MNIRKIPYNIRTNINVLIHQKGKGDCESLDDCRHV